MDTHRIEIQQSPEENQSNSHRQWVYTRIFGKIDILVPIQYELAAS
jgi:hypothetical protein